MTEAFPKTDARPAGQHDPHPRGFDHLTLGPPETADAVAELGGGVGDRIGVETDEHVRQGVPRGASWQLTRSCRYVGGPWSCPAVVRRVVLDASSAVAVGWRVPPVVG
jgi:hypothetical protein